MPESEEFVTKTEFEDLKKQIDEKFAVQEKNMDKHFEDFFRRFDRCTIIDNESGKQIKEGSSNIPASISLSTSGTVYTTPQISTTSQGTPSFNVSSIPGEVSHMFTGSNRTTRYLHNPYQNIDLQQNQSQVNSFLDPNNRENDIIEENWYHNQLDTTRLQQVTRQPSGQAHYGSIAEYKLIADIPSFAGGFNTEEFLDWVNEVERFFEFMDISEETKVKLVAYKLKGGASAWWHSLSVQRFRENRPPIRKWESMRILMESKFLPKDWRQQLFLKLQNCRQGARSIEAYVTEFYTLLARNEIQESLAQLIARFIGGLNFPVKSQMVLATHTMEDTIEMACRIENNLLHPAYSNKTNTRPYHQSSSYNHQSPSQSYSVPTASQRPRSNFRSPYTNTSASHSSTTPSTSNAQPQAPVQQSLSNPTTQARPVRNPVSQPHKSTNEYERYRGDKC